MREIKFRAWDKLKTEMFLVDQIDFDGAGNLQKVHCFQSEVFAEQPDKYILMQFTGLTDKNGKEIYEGDVVREVIWAKDQRQDIRHKICWSDINGGFWMGTTYHLNKGTAEDLEIIGNIYENSELLS